MKIEHRPKRKAFTAKDAKDAKGSKQTTGLHQITGPVITSGIQPDIGFLSVLRVLRGESC
jgi:hypothetical protein